MLKSNPKPPGLSNPMLLLALAMVAAGCHVPSVIQNTVIIYPPHPLPTRPEKFFVANAYNVSAESYRTNKQVQFVGLIEETMKGLAGTLQQEFGSPVAVEPGLSVVGARADSCLQALFIKHQASHGITITYFDAYLDQTNVEVTKTESGKEREAFYDIVVAVRYTLHSTDDQPFDTLVSVRKYHSSRSVVSGLLAAGPNIVENHADAMEGVRANVGMYMRCFFQGSEPRSRFLYVTKEFENVGNAFKLMNYSGALAASEELASSADSRISAKANYNCAVLLERMGQFDKVKPYLRESLRLKPGFTDALGMLEDYRFQ